MLHSKQFVKKTKKGKVLKVSPCTALQIDSTSLQTYLPVCYAPPPFI